MEHVSARPASDTRAFLQAIVGFAIAALVTLGASGTVYNLVAPGGWLAQVFSRSLAGGLATILALLIMVQCVKLTHDLISVGTRSRYWEMFVYGFAAAGVIYAFQYFVKGGF
jgi:hypothetical protein